MFYETGTVFPLELTLLIKNFFGSYFFLPVSLLSPHKQIKLCCIGIFRQASTQLLHHKEVAEKLPLHKVYKYIPTTTHMEAND